MQKLHRHRMKLTPIRVECYAGEKVDETPRRFSWEGQTLEVGEVLDRWYQVESKPEWPRTDYFKVRAVNDREYLRIRMSRQSTRVPGPSDDAPTM
jgi:hypothetical protein